MIDFVTKYKWFILGLCVLAIGLLIFIPSIETDKKEEDGWTIPSEEQQETEVTEAKIVEEPDEKIMVDVKGAVENPGVYEVMMDERVINVIEKAGGLKEGADKGKINFAQRLIDEMVVYIPLIGEEGENTIISSNEIQPSNNKDEEKININVASLDELQNLPGIGPSKAEAIIAYREDSGLFQTIEDLKLVTGIGDKTFEKLQERIIVK